MARNLNYQLKSAIDKRFDGGGKDKHAIKSQHTGRNMDNIYSYAERKGLIATAHLLGSFVNIHYPNIKIVADIDGKMVQEFLNSKITDCDKNSLHQYASRIHKLEQVVNTVYSAKTTWYNDLIVPESLRGDNNLRNITMTREDYNLIMDRAAAMNSKSQAPLAIEFTARFTLRVSETVNFCPKDINYGEMLLHVVDSKGGRSCYKEIKEEDKPFLDRITFGKGLDEKIITILEGSVNTYLARAEEALGIRDRYRNADTGIHCIRKMSAQEYYDARRAEGMTQKQSLDATSRHLGHGCDRDTLMKIYVLNIH